MGAAVFFYPSLFMWKNAELVEHRWIYPTLAMFQVCFGIFLMCPVNEVSGLHFTVVGSFCMSAMAHFRILLRFCHGSRQQLCKSLIRVALCCFLGVFVFAFVGEVWKTFLPKYLPFAFYTCESIGLSSCSLYP